jgi:hypothetical protein
VSILSPVALSLPPPRNAAAQSSFVVAPTSERGSERTENIRVAHAEVVHDASTRASLERQVPVLGGSEGVGKGPCLAAASRRLRRFRLGTDRLQVCCDARPGLWEAILRKMREETGATNLLGLHKSAIYRYIAPALASRTVPERQARGTTACIVNMQGEQTANVGLLGSVVEVSVSRLARNRAALRPADVSATRFLTRSDCSHSTPPSSGACGRSLASILRA